MQEVDVWYVAASHAFGEVEHEALFHGAARGCVQAPKRQGYGERDDRVAHEVDAMWQAGAEFGTQYERLRRRIFGYRREGFYRREGLQRMVRH